MHQFTVGDILALEPCDTYDRTYIECLFNGYDFIDIWDIRNAPIPTEDKFWVLASLYPEVTKKWVFTLCEQSAAVSKEKVPYKYWSKAVNEALKLKSSKPLKMLQRPKKKDFCLVIHSTHACFYSYELYLEGDCRTSFISAVEYCVTLTAPKIPGYSRALLYDLQRNYLFQQLYKEIGKCSR